MIMKIAVAAMGSEVAGHFGHCEKIEDLKEVLRIL